MNRESPSAVIERIDRQLREMWTVAAPDEVPKSRACTMNLVVVAGSTEMAEKYTAIVDEVTRSIPARALIVALDRSSQPDALEGEASAVCGVGGAASICSERVSLVARGSVCARIASAVEALCVPEMPTTLVWLDRVYPEDPVFISLAKDVQRVVLDSGFAPFETLLDLARWARGGEPTTARVAWRNRPHIADLAWTRLAVWQEMCARFFDAPNLRSHALQITKLTLCQSTHAGERLGSEGALLLGWLATRLGWQRTRDSGELRFVRADGRDVAVHFAVVPVRGGGASGELASVVIEAEVDGIAITGTVERSPAREDEADASPPSRPRDTDVLTWRLDAPLPGASEQRVRLRANRGARLLERTLHRPPADPALAEAVAFAEAFSEIRCR